MHVFGCVRFFLYQTLYESLILQDLFQFSPPRAQKLSLKSPRIVPVKVTERRFAARKANKMKNWNNLGVQAVTWP